VSVLVHALILAAGASRRMGRPKALLPVGEQTALEVLLASARQGGCASSLVVVAEPHGEAIARVASDAGATVVWNPDPGRGMFSSVQLGLAAVAPGAALIWPVDHALVDARTVRALIARLTPETWQALIPAHAGRGGHPVLLPPACRQQVQDAPPGTTLRELLRRPACSILVGVPDRLVTHNPNTPETWAREAPG
jgi:CTP:molybdopterin cytidylyltransferase MocA